MALAFRSCLHSEAQSSLISKYPYGREKEIKDIQKLFPVSKSGTDAPTAALTIPDPGIFGALASDHKAETLPTIAECAIHLELLEALEILQQKVLTSNALDRAFGIVPKNKVQASWPRTRVVLKRDESFPERRKVKWPIYLRFAATRFLEWWKCLDQMLIPTSQGGDGTVVDITEDSLPPLDVLIIWHAFLLNTTAYREFCEASGFPHRLDMQFPWPAIVTHIGAFDLFDTLSNHASHAPKFSTALKLLPHLPPTDSSPVAETFFKSKSPVLRNFSSEPSPETTPTAISTTILRDMALRQTSFTSKMTNILWLRSPAVSGTLTRAISRYQNFLTLFQDHDKQTQGPLVPTLDIDLAWHTHQCSPSLYAAACHQFTKTEKIIGHDDGVEGDVLKDGFIDTRGRYEARFGEEYNPCLCWECEGLRDQVLFDRGGEDGVDFDRVAKGVLWKVKYYKAVELARRKGEQVPGWREILDDDASS
ncbi:hypothetical protein B0H66DRAFT_470726 [Apodospora peruviana]|uniref:Uncharacterized protein n=1 Tax=Apodospora peruviana TaxID=516989 RepID=A0AAE0MD76_9PEZI|nr:hypothetical protein B0H66DRAFT_470726 [Apodospora peruviana]